MKSTLEFILAGVRVLGCKLHYLCIECSRAVCGRYKRNCFPGRGMGQLHFRVLVQEGQSNKLPTLIALLTTRSDLRLVGLAQAMFNITWIDHQLPPNCPNSCTPKLPTIYQQNRPRNHNSTIRHYIEFYWHYYWRCTNKIVIYLFFGVLKNVIWQSSVKSLSTIIFSTTTMTCWRIHPYLPT